MNHKPHVGLVDTHTEGDGSHDDVDILHQEVILRLGTGGGIKTSMIGRGLDIIGAQDGSQLLHLLTRETVDDAALAGVLFDEIDDILIHILRLLAHLIIEVRTVEGAFELHRVEDAEVFLDVGTHLIGSRSRQCDDRCSTYLVDDRADTTVFRSEVMTPFRDTMGFVDGVEGDLHRLKELHVVLLRQRLWSHVEQLRVSGKDILLHLIDSRLVQRRVQVMGRSRLFAQVGDDVHLVFHQRYQR